MDRPSHHRSSWLRQSNKTHKTTHRSNRMLNRANAGRIRSKSTVSSPSSASSTAALNRKARGNQAALRRKAKRLQAISKRRLASATVTEQGPSARAAPRIIGIIPLAARADAAAVARLLLGDSAEIRENRVVTAALPRFKSRVAVVVASRSRVSVLDVAKVADILCFVLPVGGGREEEMEVEVEGKREGGSALERFLGEAVDAFGREAVTLCKNQGLPTVVGCVQQLEGVPRKHRTAVKRHATLFFEEEFGSEVKVMSAWAESESSLQNAVQRCFIHSPLKLISWRSERSYMLVEEVEERPNGDLAVVGFLRGTPLGIHQLVHVTGQGTFQQRRIDRCDDPYLLPGKQRRKAKKDVAAMDVEGGSMNEAKLAEADPNKVQSLEEEATPDLMAGEQTWPTADEMVEARLEPVEKEKKKESYQSAWLVDDDEEGSDEEADVEDDQVLADDTAKKALLQEWKQRRMEERDEVLFPDEVEVPLDVPARERFAKYRGLKSFRQSPWHPQESLPQEYAYIHQLQDYTILRNSVLAHSRRVQHEWLQRLDTAGMNVKSDPVHVVQVDGEPYVCPGGYVRIVLANVAAVTAKAIRELVESGEAPVVLGALLPHEQKLTVVNCNVRRVPEYEEPVKARQLMTLQCGFWRRSVRPTFSENSLNCDKHKADRYLQHGRWTVASVYAPITIGSNVPAMLFCDEEGGDSKAEMRLVAAGTLLDANADRIVVKKAVVTGYPVRIKKRKAVIRFMFHNPEDVKWFKPLDLWTKYGAAGRIVDSVGTHGLFKAAFDRVMKSNDTICISLYKRVFPKPVNEFKGLRTQA